MAKLRVLHIHTLPVISGSGIHTFLTIKRLNKKRYIVDFACAPGGPLIEKIRETGAEFIPVNYFVHSINIFKDFFALCELVGIIRKRHYDIVHTHNTKAGFIGRLAAKISGVPVIIHTIHGFAFHKYESFWRKWLFIYLERIAAVFSDKLITVSTPLKEWGLSLGIGKDSQYCIIPDGIEVSEFIENEDNTRLLKTKLGIKEDELVVGMVAKMWYGKGHDVLLRAMPLVIKEVPNTRFLLVGDGYLREGLLKTCSEKGLLQHVIFLGFREDIPLITSTFDLGVLPSLFEGLGRVILESMALGKPVVASGVGGIPEIVKDGSNGLLVPPLDHVALGRAIIKILKDRDLRVRMGQEAKETLGERFTAEKMVKDIEETYESIYAVRKGR